MRLSLSGGRETHKNKRKKYNYDTLQQNLGVKMDKNTIQEGNAYQKIATLKLSHKIADRGSSFYNEQKPQRNVLVQCSGQRVGEPTMCKYNTNA